MNLLAMHLRRVTLENIRGLGAGKALDLRLEPLDGTLAGWHVVVGPNGSGKSTFVRAIALACAGPGVIKALQPARRWWLSQDADAGSVSIEVDKGPHDAWFLQFPVGDIGFVGMSSREVVELNVELTDSGIRGTGTGSEDPKHGPWIDIDKPPGWFVAGYGATRHLAGGFQFPGDQGISESRPVAQLSSLFVAHGAMPDPVAWLKQLKLSKDPLLQVALEMISDGLLPGSAKAIGVDVDANGLLIRDARCTLPLNALSDGYQTVVGLVLDLVRQLSRAFHGVRHERQDGRRVVLNEGIVLIDEIEAHLHPEWQQRIGAWMTAHFPNLQFIVTTHSPFICQAATSGCVIRLVREDEDVESRAIAPSELAFLLAGTADDIYLSSLFGVDSTRSQAAERDIDRASELEAKILDGEATAEERVEYRRLKARMPPSADVVQALRAAHRRAG